MDTKQRASDHNLTLTYTLALVAIAVLYRLALRYVLPENMRLVWNLTPVGALALFAGSRLRDRYAFLMPLGAMLISDLLLIPALGASAFYWGTPIVYGSFLAYVLLGRLIRPSELSPMVIGGGALLGSVQFFLLTNFMSWPGSSIYPQTVDGLLQCFVAGVPFYRGTLAGDLFFSGIIFGIHAALVMALRRQKASQPA